MHNAQQLVDLLSNPLNALTVHLPVMVIKN